MSATQLHHVRIDEQRQALVAGSSSDPDEIVARASLTTLSTSRRLRPIETAAR